MALIQVTKCLWRRAKLPGGFWAAMTVDCLLEEWRKTGRYSGDPEFQKKRTVWCPSWAYKKKSDQNQFITLKSYKYLRDKISLLQEKKSCSQSWFDIKCYYFLMKFVVIFHSVVVLYECCSLWNVFLHGHLIPPAGEGL